MSNQPWSFQFESLIRQVDPDTVVCRLRRKIDVGFDQNADFGLEQILRLRGCDLPEKKLLTKPMALLAMDWMQQVLRLPIAEVLTWKGDKYGRWLADFILKPHGSLVALAIHMGYALPYDGKGARPIWDPMKPYPLVRSPL